MGNNPINATDPTGHYCVGDIDGCIDGGGGTGRVTGGRDGNLGNGDNSLDAIFDVIEDLEPDADYRSINLAAGITEDYFWVGGLSLVYVEEKKELGFYYWYKSDAFVNTHDAIDLLGLGDDNLFFSPQIGTTYVHGFIWGDKFRIEGAGAFEGHANAFDMSYAEGLGVNIEFINSIDAKGNITNDYIGVGVGPVIAGQPYIAASNVSVYAPPGYIVSGSTAEFLNTISRLFFR